MQNIAKRVTLETTVVWKRAGARNVVKKLIDEGISHPLETWPHFAFDRDGRGDEIRYVADGTPIYGAKSWISYIAKTQWGWIRGDAVVPGMLVTIGQASVQQTREGRVGQGLVVAKQQIIRPGMSGGATLGFWPKFNLPHESSILFRSYRIAVVTQHGIKTMNLDMSEGSAFFAHLPSIRKH